MYNTTVAKVPFSIEQHTTYVSVFIAGNSTSYVSYSVRCENKSSLRLHQTRFVVFAHGTSKVGHDEHNVSATALHPFSVHTIFHGGQLPTARLQFLLHARRQDWLSKV